MEKRDIKYYSHFIFEDFLQDDFFIDSVLKPTEESEVFWAVFQTNNKNELADFHKAVRCIQDLNKDLPDEEYVTQVWADIRKTNHNRVLRNRWIYFSKWIAAASIVLFIFFRFFCIEVNRMPQNISRSVEIVGLCPASSSSA